MSGRRRHGIQREVADKLAELSALLGDEAGEGTS
jgi:hypothetical protein